MTDFSLLLASLAVCLTILPQYWQSKSRAVRGALSWMLIVVWALFIAQVWFGLFNVALPAGVSRPISFTLIAVSGTVAFALAIRTFVTDYRRATAERIVRESAEQAPSN